MEILGVSDHYTDTIENTTLLLTIQHTIHPPELTPPAVSHCCAVRVATQQCSRTDL